MKFKMKVAATLSAMRERKSLFIFLMGLAWKFRFSMPLLLSTSVAMLGRAWMFQIRVQSVQGLHENENTLLFGVIFAILFNIYNNCLIMLLLEEIEEHHNNRLDAYEGGPVRMIDEMAFYDDEEEDESTSWETESTDSWETLATEEAYG